MANRIITGISTSVLGALIAIVPNFSFLAVCSHCQNTMMKCSSAAKAEYGIGVLIIMLAVLLAFTESGETRMGISAALGFVGILSALAAKILIGFCAGACSSGCSCSPMTIPVLMAFGILVSVISFVLSFLKI